MRARDRYQPPRPAGFTDGVAPLFLPAVDPRQLAYQTSRRARWAALQAYMAGEGQAAHIVVSHDAACRVSWRRIREHNRVSVRASEPEGNADERRASDGQETAAADISGDGLS